MFAGGFRNFTVTGSSIGHTELVHNDDRCQPGGLGSLVQLEDDPGPLVQQSVFFSLLSISALELQMIHLVHHHLSLLGLPVKSQSDNATAMAYVSHKGGKRSSDFIKTSTGKESVNATYPVALVMVRAIRDFYWKTGMKVGFKPAGGIRSAKDALVWLSLIKEELGNEWLNPELFRIGASTLLGDIERQIYHHVTGRYAAHHDLPMA
ncbi:deoxyribose-phosphate aldolase-like [Rhinophrynus dorsalis]